MVFQEFSFGRKSKEHLKGVNEILVDLFKKAIVYSPIDFGIPSTGGLRTAQQQQALFKKGVSKCDGIRHKSKHQYGQAVDIYALVNGAASWERAPLSVIAGHILGIAKSQGINIRWGGTFGSTDYMGWDCPHFEIIL